MQFAPKDLQKLQADSFLEQIEFHPELPSTNDLADEIIRQGQFRTPLLVLTQKQTAGRGRGSNRWWSAPGALTFSLVVRDNDLQLPDERKPQVSLTVGLGICEALSSLLPSEDVGLKWPNDVFLRGKKVCGILVEIPPHTPGALILGVGINVNNSFQKAPKELQPLATSLVDTVNRTFEPTEVLLCVLGCIESSLRLLTTETSALSDAWQSRCILRGRTVHLQSGPRRTVGTCRGIDGDGALVLETRTGIERAFGGVVAHYE